MDIGSQFGTQEKPPQLSIVVKFAISLLFCFKRKDRVQEFPVPFPRFRVQHVALSDRTTVAVDVLLVLLL